MIDWLNLIVAVGTMLTPFAIAAFARDRALLTMIKTSNDQVHERINRVRDEYVREDHFRVDMARIDKRFDDMTAEARRTNDQLSEIRNLLIERKG